MAARKKSIASSHAHGGLPQIDTGVVNTLLKKQGSQAVPLYQQCTAITSRLSRVYDFEPYLVLGRKASAARAADAQQQSAAVSVNSDASTPPPSAVTSRRSVDPVQGLWDCLALGAPLCFLFNLLDIPTELRINSINLDPAEININDIKSAKQCVAKFVIGLTKLRESPEWSGLPQLFTIGDLINEPRNTNGFVKVCDFLSENNLRPFFLLLPLLERNSLLLPLTHQPYVGCRRCCIFNRPSARALPYGRT